MKNLRFVSVVLIAFALGIVVSRSVLNKDTGKPRQAETRPEEEAAELSLSKESQELIHSAAFKPRPLGRGRITPLSVSILSKPRSLDRGVEGLINLKTAIMRLSVFQKRVSVFGQIAQDAETSVHVVSPVTGAIIDAKAQIGSSVKKEEILCVVSKINGETSLHEVKAPIGGIVIGAFAKVNDRVDTVSSIYTIADLTKLWATFEVYEKDIAEIKLGQKVSARARVSGSSV